MLTFKKAALAAAVAAATIHTAKADHADVHIETVEVYGQAIPAAITTVDRKQMAPGRETGDSLRDLLGVSGSRMGGHGIDPTIRGLSQTQLNVLLDGAYVHGGCPNRMDPPTSYANATAFEEVTVIRGTQTLAYGGGGPGGTIVFSRRTDPLVANESWRGELSASWRGNSNTGNIGADVTLGGQQGYIRLLGSTADSDNYEDGNGNEVRSAYEERAGSIILGWTPSAGHLLELSYDHQETLDALYPGAGMDSPEAINDTVRLRGEVAELGLFSNLKLEAYRSEVDHVMDNFSLRTSPMMNLEAPSTSDTTGGRLVAELDSHLGLWKLGIDGQYNERNAARWMVGPAGRMLNSTLWPDVSINQTGIFAELTRQVTPTTMMTGGLRFDRVRSEAGATSTDPMGMPLSPDQLYQIYYGNAIETSRTDNNVGGLFRLEYTPESGGARYYVGVARSVRIPDATERYLAGNGMMPSARWVGNPNLEPETHHQLEVGTVRDWGTGNLNISLYLNDVSDYVLRDRFDQPNNYATVYRNVDARLLGGESRLQWQLGDGLQAEVGASYVHAENTSEDRAIAQIPPLEGFATIRWARGPWEVQAELRGAARQSRVDTTSSTGIPGQGLDVQETPGWGVVNLSAAWQAGSNTRIEVGVDNLLDKPYAQHLNRGNAFDSQQIQVNEPGQSIWVALRTAL